jgi:TPR repeat protein
MRLCMMVRLTAPRIAYFNLGLCYKNGTGTIENLTTAAEWFEKAAEAGHVRAQYNIGLCYEHGTGVEKHSAKAIEWLRRASEAHDIEAWCHLEELLRTEAAQELLGTAATQNNQNSHETDTPSNRSVPKKSILERWWRRNRT